MQKDNQAHSLVTLQKSVAADPENLQAVVALANAYSVHGCWNDALEAYQAAIKLDSQNADLYNDLGTIYEELGNTQQGEEAYQKAVALNSAHSTAYLNLGLLYQEQTRFPEAVWAFEKCLETSTVKEERSEARSKIKTILEQNADEIQPEAYGPEVVKLTADTITGQSRAAYYLAGVVLLAGSIILLIDVLVGGEFPGIAILIDLFLAIGLFRLKPGARNFTIFRATIGAILWPIIAFASNDFVTALITSLVQWGYSSSLLLLLTGQSKVWRLGLAVGIFAVFTLGIWGLLLLALLLLPAGA